MMKVTVHAVDGIVTTIPDVTAIGEAIGEIRLKRHGRHEEEVFRLRDVEYFMVQPLGYMR